MKQNNTVVTLALLGVLALAALAGGLLPAGSPVHAANPEFVSGANSRSVPENTPPGVNIGAPISATDPDETGEDAKEFGNTLTYKLGGPDAASFEIDSSTGQLITKVPLDTERKSSYVVTVTVDDGETRDPPVTQNVAISVTDVDELPAAPFPPTVVSWDNEDTTDTDESTTSLKVVWHPPVNMGQPAVNRYDVAYKKSTETEFVSSDVSQTGTNTNATITGLEPDTSYDVRVQAENSDGMGAWSFVGTGSTNKEGNSPPILNDDTDTTDYVDERGVAENTLAGENIGSPVTATDGDTTTLTYSLGGPDADLFNFNTRSGQIRTKNPLNHEDPRCYDDSILNATTCRYYVTVTVVDGAGGSDAIGVTIVVNDRTEAPSAPARPTVRATEKSSTGLDVSWDAPTNTGPAITSYEVQYRKGSDPFADDNCGTMAADNCREITGTTVTIVDLEDNTTYEVRIKATNDERASAWSGTGNGRTNRANQEPIFDDRPGTGTGSQRSTDGSNYTISRVIDENPRSGQSVGRVFADDADNDRLTYKLVAADAPNQDDVDKFTINETTGEIRTKAGVIYNYEDIAASGTCVPLTDVGSDRCYTVKVEVRDGLNTDRVEEEETTPDDSITLKIGVRDRDETPSVPTVTVTSPAGNTTLEVFWHARNTGPTPVTYDVQYRKGGGTFSDENCSPAGTDNCTGITDTDTTITELEEDTSYSVQVRARNDEGVSAWSSAVTLKTNMGTNAVPTFTDNSPVTRTVEENTPSGRNVGTAVTAEDDSSTTWTYSLGGRDAALFTIVSSSGQIRTRSALNHEDPACGYRSTDDPTTCSYTVRVKVDDRAGGSDSIVVTINVTDAPEPPIAPGAPRVTATKDTGQSLDMSWSAPRNTGKPPITDYDVEYREVKTGTSQDLWQLWPHGTDDAGNTETSTKITRRLPAEEAEPLKPRTQYEVRVRARNGENDSMENWSSVAKATTGQSNSRPSFDRDDAQIELSVDENTRAGQNIGSAISASDADSNSLTYSLEGPGADSFTLVSSSGQIRTRSPLDHETRDSYSLTVKVDDRQRKSNSVAAKSVTIMVDDVREAPSAPAAPTVAGIPGSTSSIRVTWAEPANTGPRIDGYDVHYREVGSGPTRWDHFGSDRSAIITDLKAGTRYEVQVRARSDEGTGDWSRWGSGMPNPDVANRNPAFSGGSRSLSVAENTPPNTDVGAPIAATDRDGDTLTYTLEGADADAFDVLSTSDGGQIRTSAELNHEEKASYAVTVRVRDGRGGADAANVTINVTDVAGEAPETPFAPTVTAVSSTRLQVSWEAPGNTGPPITDYDYRYREPSGSWTEVINTTITGTTLTIEGLAASTSYDVEVRATNAEGTSDWSNPGIGATNAPGANNPPVFDEGTSATRSVSASAQAGASIGQPVAATDADSSDTLTYGLEGRDAGLFDINTSSGQLLTRSGISLIAGQNYTVIVTADDQTDVARITVTIEVTTGPPNNVPVFTEGATATRTVARSATAGTAIGQPVRATDADAGTTLEYSLEGADAASFGINSANGQLSTISGVTLDQSSYTVEVVASDGTDSARITVTINVVLNTAPTFASTSTSRSVVEDGSIGDNVGAPVTATDSDQGDTLTYILGGTDAGSFTINSSTGQIQTAAVLDEETRPSYTVTVTANDETTDSDPITVNIRVTDVTYGCATGGAIADATNTRLVGDCEALLEARNKLEDGARILNWSHVNPITSWQGVYFGGTPSRVTKVIFRRGGLAGTVAAELGDLPMLTELNLHSNQLTGEIPGDLDRLSNLEKLLLHNNQLSGTIPDLSDLDNLEMLWLSGRDMNLTGGVPSWLNSMSGLESLSLWGNSLGGPVPVLTGMTSVNLLKLQSNGLTGTVPAWFADMSSLRILYLHDNNLTGTIPAAFGRHTGLVRLWLDRNDLTGSIPPALGNMTSLRTLNLRDNRLSGSIPAELGDMSSLQQLRLHNNQLTGTIPSELSDLSRLIQLWVSNNQLTGSIPAALGDLGTLRDLNLHTNQLSGDITSVLGSLTNLTRLRIGGVDGIRGNIGLSGCVPSALQAATDNDDLALAGVSGIDICQ